MNKNFKKVLVVLLSVLMLFTYMPAMAFAEGEASGASVTTSDTTEPIQYETFAAALEATNVSANATKKAVITLNEDADAPNATVTIPLTIKLNGHKLTETASAKLAPEAVAQGSANVRICRKDSDAEIIFAEHETNTVYNWEKKSTGWDVVSKTVSCDNCGAKTETVTGTTSSSTSAGKITYTWTGSGDNAGETATKTVDAETPAAYTHAAAHIVVVNKVNQHKDGLPVVKATVRDESTSSNVDADAAVTAATDAEIKKLTDDNITVYQEDGVTATTGANAKKNEPATCHSKGQVIYKVVVSKEGTAVGTIYLKDSQAADETAHVKGALKGIKWLVQVKQDSSEARFTTEEAALADANTNNRSVVKVTTYTYEENTYYSYWYYKETTPITGTTTGSVNKAFTVEANALEEDGSFTYMPVYFCNYENTSEIDDSAVKVAPLADAKTAAELANHSSCTQWKYASKAYTYTFGTGTVQSTYTCTISFNATNKSADFYSHVSDGTLYDVTAQPTCKAEGSANIKCAICGESNVAVSIPKLPDTFGAYTGSAPAANVIDPKCSPNQTVTLSADKTQATIAPTCGYPGGTYKYCTAGQHWVLQGEAVPATGHNLITVVTGSWLDTPDYAANGTDYRYKATMVCSNAACDNPTGQYQVTYHSAKGTDTLTDKYSAIDIQKEAKGKDCQTVAKTVYTVKGIKDRTGAAIVETVNGGNETKGDHVLEATNFNWSDDFESATVTAKCTVNKCTHTDLSDSAKVTKVTDATGLTTYTATYGEKSEVKKVYTLKGAEVTYDTSKITDGNLVEGIDGSAAPQTPEVTVKLNGTVIDSKELEEDWDYYEPTVYLTVTWADNKAFDEDAIKLTSYASAKNYKVAKKSIFNTPTVLIKRGTTKVYESTGAYETGATYDPANAWSVVATTTVKGATVKYAVTDKEPEDQAGIELLAFDLDKVEGLVDAGTYYVYAQLKKDDYTTYTARIATIHISKRSVTAYIDNFTMKEGETPEFNMTIVGRTYYSGDYSEEDVIDVDKSQFKVTSVGGQALEDLIPGDYALLVSSDNYSVYTARIEGRVGTVTVLTKDGKTAEEEAKAMAAAADAALADAKKVNTKNYTDDSVKNVAAAKAALQEALKSGNRNDIKAATAALEEAIKNAVAKKANPMTAKAKTVKAKAGKKTTVKKTKAFTVKKAKGKVTFKKVSGNKKITVSKAGKVVVKKGLKAGKTFKVKVKVTAAGNASYKAKSKTVTLKVKITK